MPQGTGETGTRVRPDETRRLNIVDFVFAFGEAYNGEICFSVSSRCYRGGNLSFTAVYNKHVGVCPFGVAHSSGDDFLHHGRVGNAFYGADPEFAVAALIRDAI